VGFEIESRSAEENAVVDRLEQDAVGLAVGDHVLVEAQLAGGADDPGAM
jgi:hypothetical protein